MQKKTAENIINSVREIVGEDAGIKIEETWREDEGGVVYRCLWIYAFPGNGCVMGQGFTVKGALKDFKEFWERRMVEGPKSKEICFG